MDDAGAREVTMGFKRGWFLGVAVAAAGCGKGDTGSGGVDVFTAAQWAQIQMMSPMGKVPADTTNKHADDPKAATFGQRLYFDKGLSGALAVASPLGMVGDTGKVNCATCHNPSGFFNDPGVAISVGVGYPTRNDPSLVNVTYYEYYGWGGKQDTLWMQAVGSIEGANGFTRLALAHYVYLHYQSDYNGVFETPLDAALAPAAPDAARFPPTGKPKKAGDPDGPWEMMAPADQDIVNRIYSNCAKALAAYQRLLVSVDSPFDHYVAGNYDALTAGAKRGLGLFIGKAACNACHSGPFFTDQGFHVTGIAQSGDPHVPMTDTGHFGDLTSLLASPFNARGAYSDDPHARDDDFTELGTPTDAMKGAFRTKNLRNLTRTAPYMHTGGLATLTDVVNFYNSGGGAGAANKDPKVVPLGLTSDEVADLVEFLGTTTGSDVPDALKQDTSAK
jgi:cytochrome c peroxidase